MYITLALRFKNEESESAEKCSHTQRNTETVKEKLLIFAGFFTKQDKKLSVYDLNFFSSYVSIKLKRIFDKT